MFEGKDAKQRKLEAAYTKGKEKARQTGAHEGFVDSMASLVVPDSMGTEEYQSYRQGYHDYASSEGQRRASAPEEAATPLDASEKAWYGLCNSSEFIPEETVEYYRKALAAQGHQVAYAIGLSDFTEDVCPRCGARGHFKIHFLGSLTHSTCGWSGYMKTGSYIGHQIAQIFHTGIRAGGALKNEADKRPSREGKWIYAVFGFLFVGMFRAVAAVVLIPLHCIVALLGSGRTTSQRVTSGAFLTVFVGAGIFGVYEAKQAIPTAFPVASPVPVRSGAPALPKSGSKQKAEPLSRRILGKWYPTPSVPGALFGGFEFSQGGRLRIVSFRSYQGVPGGASTGTWYIKGTLLHLSGNSPFKIVRITANEMVLAFENGSTPMTFTRNPGQFPPF